MLKEISKFFLKCEVFSNYKEVGSVYYDLPNDLEITCWKVKAFQVEQYCFYIRSVVKDYEPYNVVRAKSVEELIPSINKIIKENKRGKNDKI